MAVLVTGTLLAVLGLALAVGGVWLAALGGSWYYLLSGAGLLLAGALLIARRAAALWVYAAVVLGTLVWAVWEVGLQWWDLAPRGGVLVLLGLWLLTPWVVRDLGRGTWRGAGIPLAASLVLSLGVAAYSLTQPPRLELDGSLPTAAPAPPPGEPIPAGEWHAYGRTGFGQRYAPLDRITAANVDRLERAWTYHTGDLRRPTDPLETTYEVTPLKVGDLLYLCTPHNYVIALDAETGAERWRFDPKVPDNINRQHLTCRGVSYHEAQGAPAGEACARRVVMPTADARLIALDAGTGEVCEGFGEQGAVDLWANMPNVKPGFYYSTSPPARCAGCSRPCTTICGTTTSPPSPASST